MKKLFILVLFLIAAAVLIGAEGMYETVGAMNELPASVRSQARFGKEMPDNWKDFDRSGDLQFLQLQATAPASPAGRGAALDGSMGERIVEVQAAPKIKGKEVEWKLENKGPNPVWVVAGGMSGAGLNIRINAGASSIFKVDMDASGYSYLVIDNDGGGKTELGITATVGDTSAKTSRGKSMKVLWF
jgi:hypothetical protein